MGSYGRGIKLGKFVNNYLYKESKPVERQQIREDNVYITLYGKSKMTDHEKKSKGSWMD